MSTCTIQTFTGNYVTAVGGGGQSGQTFDALNTNATTASSFETFAVVNAGGSNISIQTATGNYVTAVGGGGQSTDAVRTDATTLGADETFTPVPVAGQPANVFALQTANGDFLSAMAGGGRTTDVFHTDVTLAQGWEWFTFSCTTPTFDPRSCTNMQYCWSADVNGDGVPDSIGITGADTPFMGMANEAVVDYSNAGHPQNFGPVMAIGPTAVKYRCFVASSFPILTTSRVYPGTGAVAVVGYSTVYCVNTFTGGPANMVSITMTTQLRLNGAIVKIATDGTIPGENELRVGAVLDPCINGTYVVHTDISVVFPMDSITPTGSGSEEGIPNTFDICQRKVVNVNRLSLNDATNSLKAATLVVGSVTSQTSDQPVGTVVASNPPADAPINYGGTVDLVLSNGNASVPPLLGDEEADALTAIADAGLVASVSHSADCNSPGDVETQNPSAGVRTLQGSTVTIKVSTCPGGGAGGASGGAAGGTVGGVGGNGGAQGGQASSGSGGPIITP